MSEERLHDAVTKLLACFQVEGDRVSGYLSNDLRVAVLELRAALYHAPTTEQVATLTTANANLASLVGEMRAALTAALLYADVALDPEQAELEGERQVVSNAIRNVLACSHEQAGERQTALEEVARCAAWWVAASNRYYEQRTVGFDDEVQDTEMANEMMLAEEATEAAVKVLAALGVKRAE